MCRESLLIFYFQIVGEPFQAAAAGLHFTYRRLSLGSIVLCSHFAYKLDGQVHSCMPRSSTVWLGQEYTQAGSNALDIL